MKVKLQNFERSFLNDLRFKAEKKHFRWLGGGKYEGWNWSQKGLKSLLTNWA
jgi:hypothetical protein